MSEADGVVVNVAEGHVWVRCAGEASACGACAQRVGCGTRAAGDAEPSLLRLPNTIHARVGDAVVIRSAEGLLLRAVWAAYGVPLLLALLGTMGILHLTGSEMAAGGGMLLGLAGGFFMMHLRRNAWGGDHPALSIGFKNLSRFK